MHFVFDMANSRCRNGEIQITLAHIINYKLNPTQDSALRDEGEKEKISETLMNRKTVSH